VATYAAVRSLPDLRSHAAGPLDIGGFARLTLGLPCVLFGFSEAARLQTAESPRVLIPLILGVALLLDFVRHAFSSDDPLLDLRPCLRPVFARAALSLFSLSTARNGTWVLLARYLQRVHHLSPAVAGLQTAPWAVASGMSLYAAGRMSDARRGARLSALALAILGGTSFLLGSSGPAPRTE
jgi:hypothetical protein